jgi:hypothetical protein
VFLAVLVEHYQFWGFVKQLLSESGEKDKGLLGFGDLTSSREEGNLLPHLLDLDKIIQG